MRKDLETLLRKWAEREALPPMPTQEMMDSAKAWMIQQLFAERDAARSAAEKLAGIVRGFFENEIYKLEGDDARRMDAALTAAQNLKE